MGGVRKERDADATGSRRSDFEPFGSAYCFDERKSEVSKAFGKSNDSSLWAIEAYLSNYGSLQKMLEVNRYEKEIRGEKIGMEADPYGLLEEDEACLMSKLYEIRAFILEIPATNEKLLLYYHYVHGESLMQCAELLDISRASEYRLKKRALKLAAELYDARLPEAL